MARPTQGGTDAVELVVGARGSPLSRVQATEVVEALEERFRSHRFVIQAVHTRGDREQDAPLEELGLGVFTGEIDRALLSGDLHMAVHSLKDVTTELPPGLTIGAVPRRKDPRDALVSPSGATLAELPPGARVGTSSPRRVAMVRALRSDIKIVPIRGNVETRLRKTQGEGYDAAVLASVGLERLGLAGEVTEYFDPQSFVPAVGQGALAVQVRSDDEATMALVRELDDADSRAAVTAERSFLRALGGGCSVPAAAYGRVEAAELLLSGLIMATDGGRSFQAQLRSPLDQAEEAGARLAQELLWQGAAELLAGEGTT